MAPHSTVTEVSPDIDWIETTDLLDVSKHLSHESVSSLFHTWTTEEDCFISSSSSCPLLLSLHHQPEDSSPPPASIRQVLEGLDDEGMMCQQVLELPPLSQRGPKRPLCTFMNFRGTTSTTTTATNAAADRQQLQREEAEQLLMLQDTGMDDADVSLPSLNEEEEDLFASASSIGIATEEVLASETEYEDLKSKVSLEVPTIDESLKNDKQLNEYLAKFHRLVAKARQVEKEIQFEKDDEGRKGKKARLSY